MSQNRESVCILQKCNEISIAESLTNVCSLNLATATLDLFRVNVYIIMYSEIHMRLIRNLAQQTNLVITALMLVFFWASSVSYRNLCT